MVNEKLINTLLKFNSRPGLSNIEIYKIVILLITSYIDEHIMRIYRQTNFFYILSNMNIEAVEKEKMRDSEKTFFFEDFSSLLANDKFKC